MPEPRTVLIIEDGNEYLENLGRFVPGPRYLQAHCGAEALELLAAQAVDLVYLDMRFDRTPHADLLGDHVTATREHNGDPLRAWRFLENNQGLFILDALRRSGSGHVPVILAYDFSREAPRWQRLKALHPSLHWVPDAITPEALRALMEQLMGG